MAHHHHDQHSSLLLVDALGGGGGGGGFMSRRFKIMFCTQRSTKHEDTPLTTEMAGIVEDVRCLRNVCQHIAIRKAVQEDVKGPVTSEKEVDTADDWSTMVMEIGMCLHEFQHRHQQKIPRHYPRPAVDTSIDTTMIKDGTRPLASTCGHELERAFCGLRHISAKDRGLALSEDVGLFENCRVTGQIDSCSSGLEGAKNELRAVLYAFFAELTDGFNSRCSIH